MEHSFDVEIAKEYGVYEAILLRHFQFWIQHNKANEINYFDGRYWTYNSQKAFCEIFPYFTYEQIRRIIRKLMDNGLLITGNHNGNKMDRRLWYALTDKGLELCPLNIEGSELQNPQMHVCKNTNAIGEAHKWNNNIYINNSNTDTRTTDIKEKELPYGNSEKKVRTYFVPPTVDEVRAYCIERGNNVDPEAFVDFYESKGWMVGKNKMKSWKAAVRTWERSRNNQQGSHIQTQEEFEAELKKFMEAEGIE